MLICYWDIRNLRENIDLVTDLLRREEPDVLILQNIANFDHTWTDAFTDYDDQRLFNSNTDAQHPKTTNQVYASRFHGGVLVLAKNEVLGPNNFIYGTGDPNYRHTLLSTTDFFGISVLSLPSYGYKPERHALRQAFEDRSLWPATYNSVDNYYGIYVGNFGITLGDLDIHPSLKTPHQPLINPATRARFNTWLATGWHDVYREHNPSGGYYTAWRRSADGHLRAQNIGARSTMAFATPTMRERVTRCWHLDRYTRTHNCPLMLYVRPYGDPHGTHKPIVIEWQPGISPTDRVETGSLVSISLGINLALPPYEAGAPTYQWYKDGVALHESDRIVNAFQHGYEFCLMMVFNVQHEDSGDYTCLVQNSTNSVLSDPVTLWVEDPIEPWIDPWVPNPDDPLLIENPYT